MLRPVKWRDGVMFAAIAVFLFSASAGIHAEEPGAHHGTAPAEATMEGEPQAEGAAGGSEQEHDEGHGGHHNLGSELPLWTGLPFLGILLSIALFPLFKPKWWHHHFPKVSAFWALVFAVPFVLVYKGTGVHEILHIYLVDYIPFIVLLWALFTVAGGILIKGDIKGTPLNNVILLFIGTIFASWIGTTGASMVMIRPILKSNSMRIRKTHIIVFFIFLVSNIGGCLTPLGDPPLFLGFIHGVPFFWTLSLFPQMAFVSIALLLIFFVIDTYFYKKEVHGQSQREGSSEPIRVKGIHNFLLLGGVMAGVLISGLWEGGSRAVNILGVMVPIRNLAREIILISMGLISIKSTPKIYRDENNFSWFPIKEVAYLFAGIFMTIIPMLAILKAGPHGAFASLIKAVKEPFHYFWVTGVLSSFLDNAPTYLTFFSCALGKVGLTEECISGYLKTKEIVAGMDPAAFQEYVRYLTAISLGAVFMGANTYIGNAPNFMVKSIAEENNVDMPSFFGYIVKYSLPILIPLFVVVTLIFLL